MEGHWTLGVMRSIWSMTILFSETDSVLIGCYDHFLYSINFCDGMLLWKYNMNGIVKSSCLLINESLICGSYESNQVVK